MNKAELINAIAEASGMTKVASKKALDATIKSITGSLAKGEKVSLVGFGTFSVAERAARTGINPSTKKSLKIPAKKVAKFKAGADLADAVK
ncbi:MAG TPA: HU family DNA-binding protein [Paludibacteraceae bacterium]|nr:HU family DNA-binding protein [Paludibacteraceae bacterium]HPT43971.1 HU family DNA-binding protein [Paludibacteraceae bacterium]